MLNPEVMQGQVSSTIQTPENPVSLGTLISAKGKQAVVSGGGKKS